MKTFGIIGYPLSHSISPLLHTKVFDKAGITADYRKFEILPQNFEQQVVLLKKAGHSGFNVTMPYKSEIIRYVDALDRQAELTGAVNTIKMVEDKWHGFNTDVDGFLYPLKNCRNEFKRCLLIGTGGAARAVIAALLLHVHPQNITVLGRDPQKAENLAGRWQSVSANTGLTFAAIDQFAAMVEGFDLVVNATPVGMGANTEQSPVSPNYSAKAGAVFYDLIYQPEKSRFLRDAEKNEAGVKLINGKAMLSAQAAKSFEIWTGISFPVQEFRF